MVPSSADTLFKTAESANQKQVRDVVNRIRCRDALVIGDKNAIPPVSSNSSNY